MSAKLILSGKEFQFRGQATIGKHPKNTVVLPHDRISRRHARVYYEKASKSYILEDLNSSYGTKLDGERVRKRERLDRLHVITLGNKLDLFFHFVKRGLRPASAETTQEVDIGDRRMNDGEIGATVIDDQVQPVPEAILDNRVRFLDASPFRAGSDAGDESGPPEFVLHVRQLNKRFSLKPGKNVVGRNGSSDISLPLKTISRRHACIIVQGNLLLLSDLYSTNHTFVAEKRVKSMIEVLPDTRIRIGEVEAVVTHA